MSSSRKFDHIISTVKFRDSDDPTKELAFDLSDITTGTTKTFIVPDGNSTIVGNNLIQTITNKTIDCDLNTLLNIDDDDIKATAAINPTKIGDGSVNSTEFGYLDGVTSSIQTQLDGMASSSHTHAATDVTSGTFADARISQSSVTQHVGAINHDSTLNYVANEHVDHSMVSITAGSGLSGGGTIAATRTIDLDLDSLATDASPDGAADYVVTYDTSAGGHKKVLIDNLPMGSATLSGLTDTVILTPTDNEVLAYNTGTSKWINQTPAEAGLATASHNHDAGDVDSGTFADARISESSVTQHATAIEGLLTHDNITGSGTNTHAQIDTHIVDATKHRIINDAGTSATELWSASKIDSELGGKADTSHTHSASQITDFSSAADARITAQKGNANGLATLNGSGKVPASQLDLDSVDYQGTWNATTNFPTLVNGTGTKGYYYVVSVAGTTTIDGINDWQTGDWIIFNGTVWEKSDHTDQVTSVAGKQGAVTLEAADVASGTFADARISQTSVTQYESAITHDNLSGSGTNTHSQIDTHIADATKHRIINDAGTSATELWSASKISGDLSGKAATSHAHSASDITSGTLGVVRGGTGAATLTQDGILVGAGTGAVTALKSNWNASVAPTATDDSGSGYAVGSRWIDTSGDMEYVCLDATATSAVWTKTTAGMAEAGGWTDDGGTVRLSTATDKVGIGNSDPTGFFEVRKVAAGAANHVELTMTDALITDDYNLGLDTTDSCLVKMTCEDFTYRAATVFASDGDGISTMFGVAGSSNSGVSWDPKFVIKHDAKIGIGKNNPAQALDIVGSIALTGTVDGRDVSTDGSTLDTHVGDATKHRIINDAGTSATELWSASKISTSLDGKAASSHTHTAADTTSGTFADARIAQTNITQHEAAIDHNALTNYDLAEHRIINDAGTLTTELFSAAEIISRLGGKAATSHTHAAADTTSGTFADARISQTSVTQHVAAIDHDSTLNFVANEHIDHTSVSVTAGVGLSGGGTIAATRTIDLDVNGLTEDTTPDILADYIVTYDASAAGHKKVLLDNLPSALSMYDAIVAPTDAEGDYTSVAAAFTAGHQTVFVLDGTYTETSDVLVPSGGCLVGESMNGAIINFASAAYSIKSDGNGGIKETAGTISITNGTSTVTGVGTTFTNINPVGSNTFIVIEHNAYPVASITSNTTLTIGPTFKGRTISGSSNFTVMHMNSTLTISNITVLNSTSAGVYLRGIRHAIFTNVVMRNNVGGIQLIDSVNCNLLGFLSQNNSGIGLSITDCYSCTLKDNQAFNSGSHGYNVAGMSNNIIIDSCQGSNGGGHGLNITGTANNIQVKASIFNNNASGGINTDPSTLAAIITGCTMNMNGSFGIDFDGANNSITNCVCAMNTTYGIQAGDNGVICNNVIYSNGSHGINMNGDNDNTIGSNNIYSNSGNGIWCDDNSNTFSSNHIRNNTLHGIHLTNTSTDNNIIGNEIHNNGQDGIRIDTTSINNKISNNQIHTNTIGINALAGSNNTTINGNTIRNNSSHGIVASGNKCTITSNRVFSNTGDGCKIEAGSTDVTLMSNNFQDNTGTDLNDLGTITSLEGINSNSLDARSATTLTLGSAVAAKVELADTGITTEAQGPLTALQGLAVTGAITVTTTVDGRDIATDGSTLDTHIADATKHRVINDTGTLTTELFSAAEIISRLGGKAATSHTHSTADVTSGTFADARISQSSVTQHVGAIDHDSTLNFVANEHIDHTSVSVTAGVGLSGGGTIAATRTIDLDINSLTADASPDGAADYIVTYDASAGTHKKVLIDNIPVSGGGDGNVTASANLTMGGLVIGNDGVKDVKTSDNWILDMDGRLHTSINRTGFLLDLHNTNPSGGNGFWIHAGEVAGDLAFKITDRDETFNIMEMEANNGYIVTHKTYAQTLADNGIVYGLDNQHSGVAKDFNTQHGTYRLAGVDIKDAVMTLTNKTINSDNNTITNIVNADIKTAAAIDAAKIHNGTVSNSEFGYLSGVTSAIQTQINGKAATSHTHSTADITSGTLGVVRGGTGAATLASGKILQGAGTGAITATLTAPSGALVGTTDAQTLTNKTLTATTNNIASKSLHSATTVVDVASATAPINGQVLMATSSTAATWQTPTSGVTDHTLLTNIGTNTHAQIDTHIVDATKHRIINDAGTSATELFSASEIISRLGGKAATSHTHPATDIGAGTVDNTEFGYLNGVTSAIQTQINSKAATSHTHAATDIGAGTVDNTEFGYLNGVTSSIQTQINGKAATSHTHAATDITSGTFVDARISQSSVTQHVGAINHDATLNFVANEHIDHSAVSVTAGVGLSGGGTIAATRTIDLDVNSLTADASPDGAADYVVTYDASATTHKKVLLNDLPGGGGGVTLTEISATTTTSTTSSSYVLINGMTSTPASGTYHVTFSSSGMTGSHNSVCNYAIYSGGSLIAHSERRHQAGGAQAKNDQCVNTQAVVTVNGSQAIEARFKTQNDFTLYQRSMVLLKI